MSVLDWVPCRVDYGYLHKNAVSFLVDSAKRHRVLDIHSLLKRHFDLGTGDFVISIVRATIKELRQQGYEARTEFYGYYALVTSKPKDVINYEI